jgi:hypothetical protein
MPVGFVSDHPAPTTSNGSTFSSPALRKVEAHLGREVNATSYSQPEFKKKVLAGDHFLSEVLRASKQFVKCEQRDLDEIIGKPRRSTTSNIQKGA